MNTKSVAEKLLIKPNTAVWLSHTTHLARIEPLPVGAHLVDNLEAATVALIFVDAAATARELLNAHHDQLARPAILWIAYPKANRADINRDTLWPILGEYGMRPVGQVAVDEVWSALRFRPLQQGEAPFAPGQ
jgi:hypothetical protein